MNKSEKILERISMDRFRWIDIHYTDIFGFMKNITIPASKLDKSSFKEGIISIPHEQIFYEEGDPLVLIPDADTFTIIPWEPSTVKLTAYSDSKYDPRKILASYKETKGYKIGSEIEFYLLDSMIPDNNKYSYGVLMDSRELRTSQYDGENSKEMLKNSTMNVDLNKGMRLQIGDYADLMNVNIYNLSHSYGRMQHEVSLDYNSPLKAADNFNLIKYIVKNAAMMVGNYAIFAPKISNHEPRNSAHISISKWDNKKNINKFLDLEGNKISEEGQYFIGGIYEHIASLSAFLSSTTLSYKDIIGVGDLELDKVMRIPRAIKGEEKRIELRWGDPAMNSYLAYTAIIGAGEDGIKNKITLPEIREITMPNNLEESLEALLSDHDYLKRIIPNELIHIYAEAKEREIHEIGRKINPYEVIKYQNI